MITQMERTGYPNVIAQPEHNGDDFFGYEILSGERFYEYDGEIIHEDNLVKFLVEELGFVAKTAE